MARTPVKKKAAKAPAKAKKPAARPAKAAPRKAKSKPRARAAVKAATVSRSKPSAKVVPLRPARPAPKAVPQARAPVTRNDEHDHEELRAAMVSEPSLSSQPAATRRTGSEGSPSRGKYVYCIIRSERDLGFGKIGIGTTASEVHTILYKDLAAVVSDTPIGVLDPTRENVLAHQRVNETVMRDHTVLPMSFGTVFKTRDDIVELLKSAYQPFGDVLKKMEDKVEFGLKVIWDRDQVIKEIEAEDESLRRLKNEIGSQKGSTYFARMQYGRLVDAALQAHSERYVAEIFQALRDVSVASRTNKPIGDKMILNAAFLVARQKEAAFDAKVKEIGSRLDKLTFKYTGPWPAYNFVNIRLKLERAGAK